MKRLSRVGMVLTVVGVFAIGTALLATSSTVEARPQYLKQFTAKYEKVKEKAATAKCAVCHEGKDKKVRNAYGKALTKAFGDEHENIKDEDKIKESLKKIEKVDSPTKGKTFGDLLEDGKLPVDPKAARSKKKSAS